MNSPGVFTLAVIAAFLLFHCEVSAKPVTDIDKLPSITTDTLYPKEPSEDSMTSESVSFIRNMIHGTQAQVLPQRKEATYVTIFRLPWRLARSVSQSSFGMAKGFVDAFAHQFMTTSSQLYSQMQKNYIPQASEAFNVWANPPKPNLQTPWLDGGV
ncbi:unnamed protein product [Orchesella dallaii]|uniref:Uncharacterized protein n=1 Tax=Orchesella dallaii TaxID=48710 RepID=A0ABP1S370_9HEXA